MFVNISNESLLLIGALMLIFIPHIHFLAILIIYSIFEEFGKLFTKIIKFTLKYILPLMALYLLCLTCLKMIIFIYNDFKCTYDDLSNII
jgi:hypothetical protein